MTDDRTREDGPPSPREAVAGMVADEWEEKYERPRGMLTDTDRRFLWGVQEYAHENTAINRRKDIRERVENGILDLFYLTMLEDRDREQVFETFEDAEPGALESSVGSFVEFLFRGLDGDTERLADMVAHGVHNGASEPGSYGPYRGGVKDVTVDIDIDRDYDADRIYERYQAGDGYRLTPAEIGVLVREGMIDDTDIWWLSYGEGGTPDEEALNDPDTPTPPMFPKKEKHPPFDEPPRVDPETGEVIEDDEED